MELHASQSDIYFDQILDPSNPKYNIGGYICLNGYLDYGKFNRSLSKIIYSSENLISNFNVCFKECEHGDFFELELLDFRFKENPLTAAKNWMMKRFDQPFDINSNELIETCIIQTEDDQNLWFIRAHHLIIDGMGFVALCKKLAEYYSRLVKNQGLDDVVFQSQADEIKHSNKYIQSPQYNKDESYWLKKFDSVLNLHNLSAFNCASENKNIEFLVDVPEALRKSLEKIEKKLSISMQQLILAALSLYLSYIQKNDVIVFGIPVHGRRKRSMRDLIGSLSRVVPCVVEVDYSLSLRGFLTKIKDIQRQDYRHQKYPISHLNRKLDILSMGKSQLYDVSVIYDLLDFDLSFEALDSKVYHLESEFGNSNPLEIRLRNYGKSQPLELKVHCNKSYFSTGEAELIAQRLLYILGKFEDSLNDNIASLSLLPDKEIYTQLKDWNNTSTNFSENVCIHELFELQVDRTPDATALTFEGESLTYAELNIRANRLAHYLRSKGTIADSLVGICLQRSMDMIVAILSVLKAGGAYVPMEPDYPVARLDYIVDDAELGLIISQKGLLPDIAIDNIDILYLDDKKTESLLSGYAISNPERVKAGLNSSNLAYVIYTSGTTGQPKGVMNEHVALCNKLTWVQKKYPLSEYDRILQKTPFSFDVSFWEIVWPLTVGARLVIARPEGHKEIAYLDSIIQSEKITVLHFVPSMLSIFLSNTSESTFHTLQRVICSGEALPVSLQNQFLDMYAEVSLINLYGPTEAAIHVAYWDCLPNWRSTNLPIGRPIDNVQLHVLDSEKNICPIGIPGELYIGGIGVARGYLNKPKLTKEKFIADPFNNEGRLYRTGDLARWLPEGEIEYLGRIDHQVKLRGLRIELGEIESIILNQEYVKECIVHVREIIEEEKQLIAYVVLIENYDKDWEDKLNRALGQALPEYMLPNSIVSLSEMPLLLNGKIDRNSLPEKLIKKRHPSEYVAPTTSIEKVLCDIWKAELDLEHVGVNESFFDLGGHSLKGIKIVEKVRQQLNLEISLKTLFNLKTISLIAVELESNTTIADVPSIEKIAHGGFILTTYAQQRLWFVDQLSEHGSAHYNLPAALRFEGELDFSILQYSLQTIVDRHESLRTIFVEGQNTNDLSGEPYQLIQTDVTVALPVMDLRFLGTDERERELKVLRAKEAATPFDLSKDLMLRSQVLRLQDQESVVLLTLHHIAADGWSLGILVDELSALYRARIDGGDNPLPALPVQYADYAHWQRQWLQGDVLEQQLSYWRTQLKGLPDVHSLPLDFPRPQGQTFNGRVHQQSLSQVSSNELIALCQREGATLFMGLHALFSLLLSRYSGERDIVIGTPIANREQPEIAGLIGLFINTLVLRTNLSGTPTFLELLAQSKQTALDAYAHQQMPFEQLVDSLQPTRSLSYPPLFQVMLSLQNNDSGQLQLPGLTLKSAEGYGGIAKYDLTLNVFERAEGLRLEWEYNTDLFSSASVHQLSCHFASLVDAVLSSPHASVFSVPLLSPNEYLSLIGQQQRVTTSEGCIHEQFVKQVQRTPDAPALHYGSECLSYRSLDEKANQLAHELLAHGVKTGALVGLCMERSLSMIVSMLGILKAGGAYVPLDPGYPIDRLNLMIDDAGMQWMVTELAVQPLLSPSSTRMDLCLDASAVQSRLSTHPRTPPAVKMTADSLAYVIYTSGSTGKPKGVMIEHRNVMHFFAGLNDRFGTTYQGSAEYQDRWLAATSISFDISVLELLWTLVRGCEVVLQPSRPHAQSLPALREEAMSFSLFYWGMNEDEDQYRLLLEGARYADEHGFEAVWLPERHFHSFGGAYPNPAVAASAVSAVTKQVQIRSGSIVLPLHDSIRVAEEWAMIDRLSGGRVGMAFASGWHPNDFVFAQDNYEQRHGVMREQLEEVKRLWLGKSCRRTNGVGKPIDVVTLPRPIQTQPSIWITAAGSEETFVYAGSIGANILTHLLGQSLDDLEQKIIRYRESREQHGFDAEGGRVTLMLHTFVSTDADFVKATVKEPFKAYLKNSIGLIKPLAEESGLDLEKEEAVVLEMAFQRYYKSSGLFGTVSECLQKVAELESRGITELACLVDYGVEASVVLEHLVHLNDLQIRVQQQHAQHALLRRRQENVVSVEQLIRRHEISHLQATPSHMNMLVSDLGVQGEGTFDSLKQVLIGGEAWPPELLENLRHHSQADLFNMYGPTETTIWSSVDKVEGRRECLGEGLGNTQLLVFDESMQFVPPGVAGELYIGGEGLGRGYLNSSSLTAEKFISNPYVEVKSDRLYRTGDLVRWVKDESTYRLEFLGRIDQQVKLRGFRIELGDIESALVEHRKVSDSVVVVRGSSLVAYVVVDDLELESLRGWLLSRLPDYMVPEYYYALSALPLTANGKVDRNNLPVCDEDILKGRTYEAPRTDIEAKLCAIWEEVLGVEKVGIHDDFFHLGGQSLTATVITAKISTTVGVEVKLMDLFNNMTICQLAKNISQKEKTIIDDLTIGSVTAEGVI